MHLYIITAIAVNMLFSASSTAGQGWSMTNDSIELFQTWDLETIRDSIKMKFCRGLSNTDYGFLDVTNRSIGLGLQVVLSPTTNEQHDSVCKSTVHNAVLAWQVRKIGDSVGIKNILFWCRQDSGEWDSDDSVTSYWGLVVLSKIEGKYESRWRIAGAEQGIRQYSHMPTNHDIYDFLDHVGKMESMMFVKNPYEWDGLTVEFLDGDVREKTWEAVIGEKPTKFFPNGK